VKKREENMVWGVREKVTKMDLGELGGGELSDGRMRPWSVLYDGERLQEGRGVYEAVKLVGGHGG
jgi:hypothetical protein